MTGQIYLEDQNVAGGEEEKEWVFAPESDNVVILVPLIYQVKHEKQTNLFRYLKFHDWLVTADHQTKLCEFRLMIGCHQPVVKL